VRRSTASTLHNHLETRVIRAIRTGSVDVKIRELAEPLRCNGSLTDFRDRVDPIPRDVLQLPQRSQDVEDACERCPGPASSVLTNLDLSLGMS